MNPKLRYSEEKVWSLQEEAIEKKILLTSESCARNLKFKEIPQNIKRASESAGVVLCGSSYQFKLAPLKFRLKMVNFIEGPFEAI